jgi:hypothetical protein
VAVPPNAGTAAVGSPSAAGLGAGELANSVVVGTFAAVGPGPWLGLQGSFNAAIWGSAATSLATTNGSLAATLGSGAGLAAGAAVASVNVPPGTTLATLAGTAATLALPTVQETAQLGPGDTLTGLASTQYLLGATVTGPVAAGLAANTTVATIVQAAAPGVPGIVQLSAAAAPAAAPPNQAYTIDFALGADAITTGTDTAASFTGAAILFAGTVQLERSFDGGKTAIVCNLGGGGQLAQYNAGTPVQFVAGEPEAGVVYRWNCTAYSSGPISYRLSQTSMAPSAWGVPPA